MAGRGRGRGRGTGLSLTQDQLQALGITRNEVTAPTLQPPPLFPKIEAKPLPLICDAATDYMLIVKDQFIEYLHDSPAYVKPKIRNDDVERYSDKYRVLALDEKQNRVLDCVWSNLPGELRPQTNRVRSAVRKRKIDNPTDIAKRLQTLESLESKEESQENTETNNLDISKKEQGNDDEEIEDEQEPEDYEVDDGTDYANNYFDNGEDYEDEDDNLDDGPVY